MALATIVIGLCWWILSSMHAGSRDILDERDEAGRAARILEAVLREVRESRRILLPPTRGQEITEPPEIAGICYLVNKDLECVLYHFDGGILRRTVIGQEGPTETRVLAEHVDDLAFQPLPGACPRLRMALSIGGTVLVDQAPLLNSQTPTIEGGRDVHEF